MSLPSLIRARDQTAAVLDALVDRFEQELRVVLVALERQLRSLVVDASDGARTAVIRTGRAAALRRQVQDALRDAGYEDLATTATGLALEPLLATLAETRLAQEVAAFTTTDTNKIVALQALVETDLLDQGAATALALWRAVVRGVFSAQSSDRILHDLAVFLDESVPRVRTLYDTSVSIFTRQVEALQIVDDPEAAFAYLGPADELNRPFCHARVGKVFTKAEIDAMDNRQLPNVFLTGGGYNCRHAFLAISKFSELRDLIGTDQRIPEYTAVQRKAA
jgi:hypothetical protein